MSNEGLTRAWDAALSNLSKTEREMLFVKREQPYLVAEYVSRVRVWRSVVHAVALLRAGAGWSLASRLARLPKVGRAWIELHEK